MSGEDNDDGRIDRRSYLTGSAAALGALAVGPGSVVGEKKRKRAEKYREEDRTTITECTTITEPGSYELAADLEATPAESCLEIRASDVLLDGAGYTISGTDSEGIGVSAVDVSDVAVTNLTLEGLATGIQYEGVTDGLVADVTIELPSVASSGVSLVRSTRCIVTQTEMEGDTFGTGIRLAASNENLLTENGIGLLNDGIELVDSTNNGLFANELGGNVGTNIRLDDADRNALAQNEANSGGEGIVLAAADENWVTGNTANANASFGIELDGSNGNRLVGNTTNDTTADGIGLRNSNDNTLTANTATDNGADGITLDESDDNRLSNNSANDNLGVGYAVTDSSRNTGRGNTADGNEGGPILIEGGQENAIEVNGVLVTEDT